jgi:glycosyltransferase involved in cell wall biosynthesis
MRVLHVSPSYYPAFKYGGPIRSVHLLNKMLAEKGLLVDVVTTNAGISSNRMTEWMNDCMREDGWCYFDELRVRYLSYFGYEHFNFSIPLYKEIKKIIKDYDLVHITAVWNFPVYAGASLCIKYKIPYIISTRGALHKEALSSRSNIIKKIYFKLFAEKYLKKASGIHYTSIVEKEESESLIKNKNSFIVPNGIDLNRIENETKQESIREKAGIGGKKYLLILGRIHRIKGFDVLIPAVKNTFDEERELFLVIAGNDSGYMEEIKKLADELKILNRIIFTGAVSGADKWSLYKNALMFILPSYSENFGMAAVEAMACGTPVVISDKVGIYREVEAAEAGIVTETSVDSFYNGIKKLLTYEGLRKRIAANGKKLAKEKYNIDTVADQMIEEYRRIIMDYHVRI